MLDVPLCELRVELLEARDVLLVERGVASRQLQQPSLGPVLLQVCGERTNQGLSPREPAAAAAQDAAERCSRTALRRQERQGVVPQRRWPLAGRLPGGCTPPEQGSQAVEHDAHGLVSLLTCMRAFMITSASYSTLWWR